MKPYCIYYSILRWILLYCVCLAVFQTATVLCIEQESKITSIEQRLSSSEDSTTQLHEKTVEADSIQTTTLPEDHGVTVTTEPVPEVTPIVEPTIADTSVTLSVSEATVAHTSSEIDPTQTASPVSETNKVETATQFVIVDQSIEQEPELKAHDNDAEAPLDKTDTPESTDDTVPTSELLSTEKADTNQTTLPEQPSGEHGTDITAEKEKTPEDQIETGTNEKKTDEKPEEEGLTFNEWTQKMLAEAEKDKQDAQTDTGNVAVPATKQRKKKNYASTECGAKVLAHNPEATNARSLLNSNKDEYMINPCKTKKWFVIELCEPIQFQSVEIASLELFSSQPKSFKVSLSDRYPSKDWKSAGEYQTLDERAIQSFTITESQDYFAKYAKIELMDHYGSEHFCPITLFRAYGIAVIDYDEEHPNEEENDDETDEHEIDSSERDADSTNLFTSAKDTVISVLKKVLNVGPDDADIANITDKNGSLALEISDINLPGVENAEMHPCLPDASAGGRDPGSTGTMPIAGGAMRPLTPEPGKSNDDNLAIVTILKDDEQVETGTLPFETLLEEEEKMKTYKHYNHCCFRSGARQKLRGKSTDKVCYFLSLVFGQCMSENCLNKTFKESNTVAVDKKEDQPQSGSVMTATEDTKPTEIAETQSEKSDLSTTVSSDEIKELASEVSATSSSDIPSSTEEKQLPKETVPTFTSEKSAAIKPTSVSQSIQQTGTVTVAEIKTGSQTITKDNTPAKSEHVTQSISIDPSFTSVMDESETIQQETREATPDITDWKPSTEDLEKGISMPLESDTVTTSVDGKIQPETTTITDKKVITEPVIDETETVAASDLSATASVEKSETSGAIDSSSPQAGVKPKIDKPEAEQTGAKTPNKTATQKSAEGPSGERKNLNLVKVPVVSVNKRETAIMRLNNRIKVLEQNVSLSSRFLEELSKRYKKQSEDMMKMLNKTLSQLNNATVESEVKHKLHEEEMTVMERRLQNLTSVVHDLSITLHTLDQQVRDRQMFWISIEIVIIIVLFLLVNQKRKKEELSVESRQLLAKMPAEPRSDLPQRRNSISGPATPSKKQPELIGGSPLHRFNSETALDQDFLIIEPMLNLRQQVNDGVKKKKKKKQKLAENRAPAVIGPSSSFPRDTGTSTSSSHSNSCGGVTKSSSSTGWWSFFSSGKSGSDTGQASLKTDKSDSKSTMSGTVIGKPPLHGVKENCVRKSLNADVHKHSIVTGDKGNKNFNKHMKNFESSANEVKRVSPSTGRRADSMGVKGHRRQRSLPKQHYLVPESRDHDPGKFKTKHDRGEVHAGTNCEDIPKKAHMRKSASMQLSATAKHPSTIANRRSFDCSGRKVPEVCDSSNKSLANGFLDRYDKELQNRSQRYDHVNCYSLSNEPHYPANGWDRGGSNSSAYYIKDTTVNNDNKQRSKHLNAFLSRERASSLESDGIISNSFSPLSTQAEGTSSTYPHWKSTLNSGAQVYS